MSLRLAPLLLALAAAACSGGFDVAAHMTRARDFAARGEHRSAMIEVKNVLAHTPDDVEARLLLATTQLALGDAAAAEKEFRRAADLGAPPERVRLPHARALLELNEPKPALALLEQDAGSDPATGAEEQALRGNAHALLGERETARSDYLAALALDPHSVAAHIGLAQLELEQGATDAAEQSLRAAVDSSPQLPDARLALGRFLVQRQRYEEAQSQFEQSLAGVGSGLSGARVEALAGIAEAQLGRGDRDGANATVARLDEIASGHPLTQFLHARVAFDGRQLADAGRYLDQVLARAPDFAPAKLLQGAVSLAGGDYARAEMFLSSVLATDADNLQARKLLAASRLGLQQPQAALDVLSPAQAGADAPTLALLGHASVRKGDYDSGLDYLERSLRADPDNPALQLELAAAYLAAGRVDDAIGSLGRMPAAQDEDALRKDLLLVLARARKHDWDGARELSRSLVERFPEEPMTHSLSGSVELAAGRYADARSEFERAAALRPDSSAAALNLARVDHAEGDANAAYARLSAFLARAPDDLLVLLALAELDDARGDGARALEHLRHACDAHPDAIQPRLALARTLALAGDYAAALTPAEEAVQLQPDNASAQSALGVVQLGLGRNEEALASLRKSASAEPDSADTQYYLGRALLGLGRRTQARDALAHALSISPGHVLAGTLLAKLALESGRPEEALDIADKLEQAQPGSAAADTVRGDVFVARARYDDAARAYARALERSPDPSLVLRLYEARRAAGASDARATLAQWLDKHPDDVPVQLAFAQAAQDAGDAEVAVTAYERVLATAPASAVALNNLAWLYAQRGDARALATAERAHAAAPDSGEVTDTLGWLLVQHGDVARALPLLRDATERSPDVAEIRYHLAVALAHTGAKDEARTLLRGLLDAQAQFESAPQARELLEEL
jgi:putative PEP-CTERM system TPR-repeat lipoprotein